MECLIISFISFPILATTLCVRTTNGSENHSSEPVGAFFTLELAPMENLVMEVDSIVESISTPEDRDSGRQSTNSMVPAVIGTLPVQLHVSQYHLICQDLQV